MGKEEQKNRRKTLKRARFFPAAFFFLLALNFFDSTVRTNSSISKYKTN